MTARLFKKQEVVEEEMFFIFMPKSYYCVIHPGYVVLLDMGLLLLHNFPVYANCLICSSGRGMYIA